MKGYKAYKKGLICKGFQYEEGKIFKTDKAICCSTGFHFCENPLDTLNYYDLCESEFTEVEALGDIDLQIDSEDTKCATNRIKIGAKLDLKGFINASFDFLWSKCTEKLNNVFSQVATSGYNSQVATSGYRTQVATSGDNSKVATSGYYSQVATSGHNSQVATSGHNSKVATSGYNSQVATSGDDSQVATSGDRTQVATSGHNSQVATSGDNSQVATSGYNSQVATSGYNSQVATSGDNSQVATSGYNSQVATSGDNSKVATSGDRTKVEINGQYSVGAAIGINSTIKGEKGNWITLAEWVWDDEKETYIPVCVKSAQIDGEILKPNTYYQLVNSEFVEVIE